PRRLEPVVDGLVILLLRDEACDPEVRLWWAVAGCIVHEEPVFERPREFDEPVDVDRRRVVEERRRCPELPQALAEAIDRIFGGPGLDHHLKRPCLILFARCVEEEATEVQTRRRRRLLGSSRTSVLRRVLHAATVARGASRSPRPAMRS